MKITTLFLTLAALTIGLSSCASNARSPEQIRAELKEAKSSGLGPKHPRRIALEEELGASE